MSLKQTIKMSLLGTVTLGIIGLSIGTTPALAQSQCGKVNTAIITCSQRETGDLKDSGVWGILILVINIMTAGIGILAVGAIAYGAILYSTAGGSAEQTKKAITVITNTVIGLVCFLFMTAILNFLIPGGIFNVIP